MKALGRPLAAPFDAFWDAFADEIPVGAEDVERGSSRVFGDQGADLTAPAAPRWLSLPDDDLAYHAARELALRLMESRGYPRTVRGAGYPADSAEARVGADLAEMVLAQSLNAILAPFGFRRDFILRTMADGALGGLRSAPVPEYGSPWHFTWAIRHCLLATELPEPLWTPIEALYERRAPRAAALGRELRGILGEIGRGGRERALEAMVKARDALALDVQGKVLVLDPVSGDVL